MKKIVYWFVFSCITIFISAQNTDTAPPPEFKEGGAVEPNAPEVYTYVEEMPEYPGGSSEMIKFISKSIVYPKVAAENGIYGTVFVRFIVDKDGSVIRPELVKSLAGCPECDAEALRVLKILPKWRPGKSNGKFVPVYYTTPIKFKLPDEKGK
jgi:periplasmic protein TonB